MTTQVKKASVKDEGKNEEKPESKKFFVVPAVSVLCITAANEREAVREASRQENSSGKYIVVEADYTEVFTTSQRIELKADTTDSLFSE